MRCSKCHQQAWVELRRYNAAYCSQHFMQFFQDRVEKNILHWKMMTREDRVLVAVSGGKDSLALWEVLLGLGYRASGLHIALGIGEYSQTSRQKTERFAAAHGAELTVVDLKEDLGAGIEVAARRNHRVPCSACGLTRRYLFNEKALEGGFTVLATGHNLDDEAATLLGNLLHWQSDALARQSPVLPSTHPKLVKKVKPFFNLTEKETASYALIRKIDYVFSDCPNAEGARSLLYKQALNLIEQDSPGAKYQLLNSFLEWGRPILKATQSPDLRECTLCGQVTTAEVCAFCRLWERVRQKVPVAR